jgi:hypothetical protein
VAASLEVPVDPHIARRAAGIALLLGIFADVLFDRTALGINVPIATAAILVSSPSCSWRSPG